MRFAPILKNHELDSFDALMNYTGGKTAKNVLQERVTTRIDLSDSEGQPHAFYIKRHTCPTERVSSHFSARLRKPLLSARYGEDDPEFSYDLISTMIPVAFGERGAVPSW
ncbi:MAG: hypothetical protein R3C11_18555 [Planctomycetaceae bacterium]